MTKEQIDNKCDEYMGTVFGATALAFVSITELYDFIDMLQERHPELITREVRRELTEITGNDHKVGCVARVRCNINETLAKDKKLGMNWLDDFGNTVYGEIEDDIMKLRYAIAIELGRYKGITDANAMAVLLVAQSLAHEQQMYCERRAKALRGYSIKLHRGSARQQVAMVIRSLSCDGIAFRLTRLSHMFLDRNVPEDINLVSVPTILNGCKVILKRLASIELWEKARDNADRLNGEGEMKSE